jgi:hypothetical protein
VGADTLCDKLLKRLPTPRVASVPTGSRHIYSVLLCALLPTPNITYQTLPLDIAHRNEHLLVSHSSFSQQKRQPTRNGDASLCKMKVARQGWNSHPQWNSHPHLKAGINIHSTISCSDSAKRPYERAMRGLEPNALENHIKTALLVVDLVHTGACGAGCLWSDSLCPLPQHHLHACSHTPRSHSVAYGT